MADCQQENFYLRWRWRWQRFFQPANQILHFSRGYIFSAHASICPIRLVKLRGTVDFHRPKRQYPERPRPVSTVYFIKVLDISDNW